MIAGCRLPVSCCLFGDHSCRSPGSNRSLETALELLQTRRSLRVEWYIVILIVVEILLTLYDMFVR